MSELFKAPTLRLTPSWTDSSKQHLVRDGWGLIVFRLALWVDGKEHDHMPVVSGQAYNQVLLPCTGRMSGCAAPIGEGVYALGDPDATNRINWASGRVGDYSASFKAGLGPIWCGIHATKDYPCSTSDFGIHADWNADEGAPGTLGCTGLLTPGKSLVRLKQFASWCAEFSPSRYVVDHGLGTVPKPTGKIDGNPVEVEVLPPSPWTKFFANANGITALRGGKEQKAMAFRVDFHAGKVGVSVNGIQLPPNQIEHVEFLLKTKTS